MGAADGKEEGKSHMVRFDATDWRRIEEAVEQMSREQHLDLTPSDVIRSAVRRFCEDRLGPVSVEPAA